MRKNSTMKNRTPKSVNRGRVAVVTGGLVAAIALGSAAAHAADVQHEGLLAAGTTGTAAQAVQQQAAGQQAAAVKAEAAKVAAAQKAAAAKKAAAEAKVQAAVKAAAAAKAKAASWVAPTSGFTIGASYAQSGSHWAHKHSGQDFVVSTGHTVRSVHGGTVVEAGWGGAYGNNIVIKHADHTYSQYGHLSSIAVHVGETVGTGEQIGKSGSTGNSTGPHLHFEIRTTPYYGSSVEPLHFLRAHGVNL